MQQHTYAIMDRVEDSHWWFVGRRAILESFLQAHRSRNPQSAIRNPQFSTLAAARVRISKCFRSSVRPRVLMFRTMRWSFAGQKDLTVQKGLAETLPVRDETFDVTTALDVVEHLDDDIAGLKEMYRVTKRGGYSLIFVPAFMWLWGVQDDISNHRIRYTEITDRRTPEESGLHHRTRDLRELDILHADPRRPHADETDRHQTRIGKQRQRIGAERRVRKTVFGRAVLAEEF